MNKYEERATVLGKHVDLFEVCMALKGDKDGSADPLLTNTKRSYITYLKVMLKTWEVEPGTVKQVAFDFAVRDLIIATLELVQE